MKKEFSYVKQFIHYPILLHFVSQGFKPLRFRLYCFFLCLWFVSTVSSSLCGEVSPVPLVLTNGLRVMICERHVVPLVAIDLWVQAGAREEKTSEFGSAHFLEHVLFKGTSLRPLGQTDIDIENLGGTLNAATGPDYAHFYTTLAVSKVPQALDIICDMVRNAVLPDAEITRERGVILDELAQHDSNPTALLIDLLYANAFTDKAYGRSPGGSPAAISLLNRGTLAAFHRHMYRPNRCILVLAGDLTSLQAEQWARQSFGSWPASSESSAMSGENPAAASVSIPILPAKSFTIFAPVSHAIIGLAFPTPPALNHTMTTAALLAAEILGDRQQNGRLLTAKLSAITASAHFTPRWDSSLLIITAAQPIDNKDQKAQSDTAKEQDFNAQHEEEILRGIVSSLSKSPPSLAEILAAKRRILGKMVGEQETCAGLASSFGYAAITGGESPEAQREHIQRLTNGELQQFIHLYLSLPGLCIHLKTRPQI